jgi:hypothetical protein
MDHVPWDMCGSESDAYDRLTQRDDHEQTHALREMLGINSKGALTRVDGAEHVEACTRHPEDPQPGSIEEPADQNEERSEE